MPYASKEKAKEHSKQYYQTNREKIIEQSKEYQQAHPEKRSEYYKRYSQAHPEKARERNKRYRQTHLEKEQERYKQYYQTHLEKERERSNQYNTKHPDKVRERIYTKRGKRFSPINIFKPGYSAHHLYLESNNAFCVYIPEFVHSFYPHNSKTWEGMDTINAVALSIFIDGDEQFLKGAVA